MAWGAVIGAVGAIGGAVISSRSANKAADHSEEAAKRKLAYDTDHWEARWSKLNADRAHLIEGIAIRAANEEREAAYKDATNQQNYAYRLAIRNREQAANEAAFAKSNELYDKTVSQNAVAAKSAAESEWRKLDEIHTEAAFNAQEQRLEYLRQEGAIRAKGVAGRSAGKVQQSAMSSYGQQVAMLNEGIASAGRNTKAMLDQIQDDQYSADLAAWAAKMLDPGELPMPVQPLAIPRAIFQQPRELDETFDKGPAPVLGAYMSNAAAGQAWGAALPGIASSINTLGGADGFGWW